MQCHNHTRQIHGFTLIEVLVASVILAVGLMGVASMIGKSTIQDSRSYYTSQASLLMEEYLENSTRIQYNATAFNNFSNSTRNATIDGIPYNMECSIARNQPYTDLNTIQTTCTINWNNKGLQASTQYVYIFSRKF